MPSSKSTLHLQKLAEGWFPVVEKIADAHISHIHSGKVLPAKLLYLAELQDEKQLYDLFRTRQSAFPDKNLTQFLCRNLLQAVENHLESQNIDSTMSAYESRIAHGDLDSEEPVRPDYVRIRYGSLETRIKDFDHSGDNTDVVKRLLRVSEDALYVIDSASELKNRLGEEQKSEAGTESATKAAKTQNHLLVWTIWGSILATIGFLITVHDRMKDSAPNTSPESSIVAPETDAKELSAESEP